MQTSTGWKDLAGVISSLNEETTEVILDRAAGLPSIFQMSDEDLDIRLNELGQYFRFGEFSDESKAMVVQQRLDELHLKDTLYPLKKTLSRELFGVEVAWFPLYCHKDEAYGDNFLTKPLINDMTGWWMTNRGVLRVNLDSLSGLATKGLEPIDYIEDIIGTVAEPLIPLDIVYDGIVFYLRMVAREDYERASLSGEGLGVLETLTLPENRTVYSLSLGDEAPLDSRSFDSYSWSIYPTQELAKVGELESISLPDSRPISFAKLDEYGVDGVAFDGWLRRSVREIGSAIEFKEILSTSGFEQNDRAKAYQDGLFSLPEVRIYTPAFVDESRIDLVAFDADSWSIAPSWEGGKVTQLDGALTLPDSNPLIDAKLDEFGIDGVLVDGFIKKSVKEQGDVTELGDAITLPGMESQELGFASPTAGDFTVGEPRILTAAIVDELPLDVLIMDGDSWTRAPSWEGASITSFEFLTMPTAYPRIDARLDEYSIDGLVLDTGINKQVKELVTVTALQDAVTLPAMETLEGGFAVPFAGDFTIGEPRILTPAIVDELPIDVLTMDGDSWTRSPSWEGATVTLTGTFALPESYPLVDTKLDEYAIDTTSLDIGVFKPVYEASTITNLTEDD